MKVKKGDTVLIITGKDRGKTGLVESVFPRVNRLVVTGLNKYKKHQKPSTKSPQGGIIEISRAMDVSNVMVVEPDTKKPTRVGYLINNNEKNRIARLTGKTFSTK